MLCEKVTLGQRVKMYFHLGSIFCGHLLIETYSPKTFQKQFLSFETLIDFLVTLIQHFSLIIITVFSILSQIKQSAKNKK